MPTLFPLTSLAGICYPIPGAYCWTGVSLRQPGRVPVTEPFLNIYCLLCSGLDQTPQWDSSLQGLGSKYYKPSTCLGAGHSSSSLLPSKLSALIFVKMKNTFHEVVMLCVGNITESSVINVLIMEHI